MSECCSSHSEKRKTISHPTEEKPKSFIGRFLYNVGKKDAQKENNKKCH